MPGRARPCPAPSRRASAAASSHRAAAWTRAAAAAWPGSPSGPPSLTAAWTSPARPAGRPRSPSSCRCTHESRPMRIVIAEDAALFRAGLVRLLQDEGHQGRAAVAEHPPDVVIADIRMPPTWTDEGLRAAVELRRSHPGTAVLVLSQYIETGYAARLLSASPAGVGYLLKDRVAEVDEFTDAVTRIAAGGTALDPEVVRHLLAASRRSGGLDPLTARERDVLALMAEGRSNAGIADALVLSLGTVEKHVASIFAKLGLPASETDNRRVLAVLHYLRP